MSKNVVIVGAGLAGCCAARLLAEKGYIVSLYEKNNHIGGNLYDYYDDHGILIHKYGPHIFHTSYEDVWSFVNRFAKFNNFINQVLVNVDNKLIELPINLNSIESLFGNESWTLINEINKECKDIESISIKDLMDKVQNCKAKKMLQYIFDNVYANYTSKMWGIDIKDIDPNIISRVKINLNRIWNYFAQDKYQGLPINGYTEMLKKMVDHENINLYLNNDVDNQISFEDELIYFNNQAPDILIYSGQIDSLFNFCFGELEYRSLDIVFETYNIDSFQNTAVVNYPNDKYMTRITEYKKMTLQNIENITTISKEFPGKYDKQSSRFNIPFYPINDKKNNEILNKYQEQASKIKNLILLGRLAQYKYFDMDDVIFHCFSILDKFIKE